MKFVKTCLAAILVCVMALGICGCHTKNEVAVTIGDYEYTSAYYMCALVNAYYDGQAKVYETLNDTEKQGNVDYLSKKIEDKDFSAWVKDRAIEILKTVSYYKSAAEKAGIKIEGDDRSMSDYYAEAVWENYKTLFEQNGVGEDTFKQYFADGAPSQLSDYALYSMAGIGTPNDYEELYFQKLYGKGGKKEIAAKSVKNEIYNNYIVADVLEVTYTDAQDKAARKSIKKKFKKYEEQLTSGKKTFADVYKDYNNVSDRPTSDAKDPYASILDASSNNFSKINKMKTDEIKLVQNDDTGISLVVKKDIKADKYYLNVMDTSIRHKLKDEEYAKDADKQIQKLKADINKYAVNRFKVNKIVLPENGQ